MSVEMNHRERVISAIEFKNPDRTPIWLFNKDEREGDILWYDFRISGGAGHGYHGGKMSEWGYEWEVLGDGTMGQPKEAVISTWEKLNEYKFPSLNRDKRLANLPGFMAQAKGYYKLPLMIITGFTIYTFLRGFENAMIDFVDEPENAAYLLDRIFAFEKDLITLAAETGFDGFHFGDDWGTQTSLIISPTMWRELFKPRYKDLFDHAHAMNLHVWYHSCGNVSDLLEDFHEIGVDVMNIAQPNVVNIAEAGRKLCGKQCFMAPISYQSVSISGTREEILHEGLRLHNLLAAEDGGFIGYVEEYGCMGMGEDNYKACIEAFQTANINKLTNKVITR